METETLTSKLPARVPAGVCKAFRPRGGDAGWEQLNRVSCDRKGADNGNRDLDD
jgi:hypothetical protein